MHQEWRDLVDDTLVESCVKLFGAYDVSLEQAANSFTDTDSQIASLAGVIGFTGDDVRGTIVLSIGEDLVVSASDPSVDRRDWVAELANQLLGRFKNQLLAYGVDLSMSTPITIRGLQLELAAPGKDGTWHYDFESTDGAVRVWFDTETDEGFEVSAQRDEEAACHEEGALLFF